MEATKLIELKQERATLTASIRTMMDKYQGKEMDGADKDSLTNMEKRFDEVTATITREEKQLERERVTGEAAKAPQKTDAKTTEIQNVFKDFLLTGSKNSFETYNALTQSNPTQAGYLVAPEQFMMELIKELADATFMRQKADVKPPLRGAQSLGFPMRTAGMSSFAWGTETSAPTPDTTLAYGKREFKPNPGTSEILISNTLIRNSPQVDSLVRTEIVEEVSGEMETAYMTGDGAGKPLGVFTASNDGIPTSRDVSTGNTQTEIKIDGLIEAQMLIKQKYQPGCEWIFHRDAVKQLRKLKTSDGQYIWQPSIILNQPDVLLGKAVNMSEYAPNTFTTGLYVGLYGYLKQYWIVDSLLFEIRVLTELYARSNQVDYITRLETDGAPIMPAAFSRVKLA